MAEEVPILRLSRVYAGYGKKQVLNGIDLRVSSGQVLAVIGHNGAGKSTMLRVIFGLLPTWRGEVYYDGSVLDSYKPRDLLRRGIAYVPQGNRVFSALTVRENLEVGASRLETAEQRVENISRALTLFPLLAARLRRVAGTLSGGEKQMLAMANILAASPRLLLLDELSLGLAPTLVGEVLERVRQMRDDAGVSVVIVEQKVRDVLAICDRVCCLKLGEVTYLGDPSALLSDERRLRDVFL